jgi:hypothetical protein
VVWSIVRMDRSIYHHHERNENSAEQRASAMAPECFPMSP